MIPDIAKEVEKLHKLATSRLGERYAELYGEPSHSRHRTYLIRKIAWKLQARAQGDLSERARRRAEELAADSELRVVPPKYFEQMTHSGSVVQVEVSTDPRLPAPGTALVRVYKGKTYQVIVLADGFEFEGERYRSLSAIAKKISGAHCNGFRFFKLEVNDESR